MTRAACAWCRGKIPDAARRDAVTCSKRCRQARHRFTSGVGVARRSTRDAPLRLAYADPPYPGLSERYYSEHPDFGGEVDHADLIRRLCSEFDGWALSTSAASLQHVLALCPPDVRVASWHRGERPTRSSSPLNAWEPVIFRGGRLDPDLTIDTSLVDEASLAAAAAQRDGSTRRTDTLVYFSRPRLTDPDRVVGAKPARFIRWMFELLGALPHDEFLDLYPGSGGVSRAWSIYSGSNPSPLERNPS